MFSVESAVRTEVRHDTEDEGQSVQRRRRGALSAGNRYRLCQTPADVVPRESCRRSSGRATVQSTLPPTTGSSTLRAGPRNQLRRPGRFHSSADRHVHDRHVLRRRHRCSAVPLICCSAHCFGDIYVLCAAFSVPPSFSYSPLGPLCFPYCCTPRLFRS